MRHIVSVPGGGLVEWIEGGELRSIPSGEPVELSVSDISRLSGLGFVIEQSKEKKSKEAPNG